MKMEEKECMIAFCWDPNMNGTMISDNISVTMTWLQSTVAHILRKVQEELSANPPDEKKCYRIKVTVTEYDKPDFTD